jgi:hypothetical protein
MKTKLSWFDKMMIEVTYAECNALDSIRDIRKELKSMQEETVMDSSAVKQKKISPLARLKNIFKSFEDTMTATAFTDAGEHASAFRIYQNGKNARKKVLLGTDNMELDLQVIGYALKLCHRVEAGLEILHVINDEKEEASEPKRAGVSASPRQLQSLLGEMGIEYSPVKAQASLQNELIDQVTKRNNIMCVVVGSPKGHKEKTSGRNWNALAKAFGKLNCPLVVCEQPVPAA